MNTLKNITLAAIFTGFMFSVASIVNAETVAIMDVTNQAFKMPHPNYGRSQQFRNSVAELISETLWQMDGVDVYNAEDLRNEVWNEKTELKYAWAGLFSDKEAINEARIRDYDYVVLAKVLETKVKESQRYVQGERWEKYSLWTTVEVRVLNTLDNREVLNRTYVGRHELQSPVTKINSREFEYFQNMLAALDYNEMKLADSELGVPFKDVAGQLLEDLENTIEEGRNIVLAAGF